MFLKKKIALTSTLILGIVTSTVTSVALAGSAQSPKTGYEVGSYRYSNYAEVQNSSSPYYPNDVVATGHVEAKTNVPTGYMGLKTELYYEGNLCKAQDWYYNKDSAAGLETSSQKNCGAGNYTATGQTAAYSFGEYKIYDITSTPKLYGGASSLTITSSSTSSESTNIGDSSFPKNKNGETYGSAENVASGSKPDLIKAVGVDGTLGYVRAKDLDTKMLENPEAAISKQRSLAKESYREIKLYDENGENEIGTFRISQKPDNVKETKKN